MITDAQGKPMPKQTAPKEGEDLIQCEVLVESLAKFEIAMPIMTPTPQGPRPMEMTQALTAISTNLYQIMRHMKQKEIVIRIQDLSSEMVKEKQLTMGVGELVKPEVKTKEDDNQEAKEGSGE
jgi:hypothetical protein